MANSYTVEVQNTNFVARLKTHDLGALLAEPGKVAELQNLLDKYMVLIILPEVELTKPAVGNLALHLGFPESRRNPRNIPADKSDAPGFDFIGNFGGAPRELPTKPSPVSFIGSLHYDRNSYYSVQANFNVPRTTPNLWVDMRAAYRDLPLALRTVVDKSFALHAVMPPPGTPIVDFPDFDQATAERKPLLIKHSRTQEPLLYLPKNAASKIEGMPDDEGRDILHQLWDRVNTAPTRYASMINHNEMVVWDGVGTTHTNPSYPRDKPRTTWFFTIPAEKDMHEHYFA